AAEGDAARAVLPARAAYRQVPGHLHEADGHDAEGTGLILQAAAGGLAAAAAGAAVPADGPIIADCGVANRSDGGVAPRTEVAEAAAEGLPPPPTPAPPPPPHFLS